MTTDSPVRPPLKAGALELDVQAGIDFAAYPAKDGLPLEEYTHVEVRILRDGQTILPSECGFPAFDIHFSDDKVARCLSVFRLGGLMDAMGVHE